MSATSTGKPFPITPDAATGCGLPEPFTFEELATRWHCSVKTVSRRVGNRVLRMGRTPLVRAAVVAQLEARREGV